MKFVVSGVVEIPNGKRNFTKEVEAKSENHAKDLVCSLIGSTNGVKRNKIKIASVEKVT